MPYRNLGPTSNYKYEATVVKFFLCTYLELSFLVPRYKILQFKNVHSLTIMML